MSDSREQFDIIVNKMVHEFDQVCRGKMMSCDAIVLNKKVFAFLYKESMVFKLGKAFDLESLGIKDYDLLNPFKNKSPLKNWYVISAAYMEKWDILIRRAYEIMKGDEK